MLTIQQAAAAIDLDMARSRMQVAQSDIVATQEWEDLTPQQRESFLAIAIATNEPQGVIHEERTK